MKAFIDTSVLIAAFHTFHRHHQPSFALLRSSHKKNACCGAHSLAEVYATLTSMPPPHRASGDHALLFINGVRGNPLHLEHERFSAIARSHRRPRENSG